MKNVNIEYITAPFIGGMIGLITNSLAIKMLFRPYREIRILGIHVPFTPGLIPKEKPRIARAIAQVISNYILDQDTILLALASEKMKEAFEKKYDEKLAEWKKITFTCGELLEQYDKMDSVNIAETKLRNSICAYLLEQCQKEDLVRKLTDQAFIHLRENMNSFMYKMAKGALNATREAIISQAEELLATRGMEVAGSYIDGIYLEWLDRPVCEVVKLAEQKVPDAKQILWDRYEKILREKSGQFLAAFNVREIVEDRINAYDVAQLEEMIMEISRKELQALVWLGGLLGVLMGFVNLLF